MYNNKKVTLLIPCYNEEKGIEKLLQEKFSFIDEFIVVDNNSNDNTAGIARQRGVVISVVKRGYGLAYQAGLAMASGDIIVMMDGDSSYSISEAERLVIYMETNKYDFITGCRFPLSDIRAMPWVKKVSNYLISGLIRKIFYINLMDSQSGLFVFKRDLLPKIVSPNPGMGFSQELKLNAWLGLYKCAEMHIDYRARVGKVKFKTVIDSFKTLYGIIVFWFSHRKNMFI